MSGFEPVDRRKPVVTAEDETQKRENIFLRLVKTIDNSPLKEPSRAIEIVLFPFIFSGNVAIPGVGLPIPVGDVAAALLVIAVATRKVRFSPIPTFLPVMLLTVFGLIINSSFINGDFNMRRLAHLFLWGVLIIVFASGRVHLPSAARGMVLAVPLGLAYSTATGQLWGADSRVTGVWGDPNVAAYTILISITIGLFFFPNNGVRLLLLIPSLGAIALAQSRTSFIGLLLIVAWGMVGRRFSPGFLVFFLPVAAWAMLRMVDVLRNLDFFLVREGSDMLRDRVLLLEETKTMAAGWFGFGAGSAQVVLESGRPFFYHNSYFGLATEGGWLAAGVLLLLLAILFVRLHGLPPKRQNWLLESAFLVVLTTAFTIGEVLLDLQAAVTIGAAVQWYLLQKQSMEAENELAQKVEEEDDYLPLDSPWRRWQREHESSET